MGERSSIDRWSWAKALLALSKKDLARTAESVSRRTNRGHSAAPYGRTADITGPAVGVAHCQGFRHREPVKRNRAHPFPVRNLQPGKTRGKRRSRTGYRYERRT